MAALSDREHVLIQGTGGYGETIKYWKSIREGITGAAIGSAGGCLVSYFYAVGSPGHGVLPGGTARNPTNATAGALGQTDATGGRTKYLVDMNLCSSLSATVGILVDRLADISGLVANSALEQTITGLSVTRYTGTEAAGNIIALEAGVLLGATPTTVTAKYTNQAGTAGQVTPAIPFGGVLNGSNITAAYLLPLAQGDTGVQSVQSITLAGSTAAAGNIAVAIVRPLASYCGEATGSAGWTTEPLLSGGPIEIKAGACLTCYGTATTAPPPSVYMFTKFVEI